MRSWFARIARVASLEWRQVRTHRIEWIAGFVVPLFCCLIMTLLYGTGAMTRLPVGIVDLDGSALSRSTTLALEAAPSLKLIPFSSPAEADRALRARGTYATITLPENFELDSRRGEGAPVELAINKTYYAVGTILELDVKSALSTARIQASAVRATAGGGTFVERAKRLRMTFPDVEFLGNPAFNFTGYLMPTFVPGLMALGALLGFTSMLVREWREGGIRRLLKVAGGSSSAIVIGKFLPWVCLWFLAIGVWTAGFSGWAGWGLAGSIVPWLSAGALLMLSMAGLAAFAAALSPTWVIALSMVICLIAPTFPFTDFSFPLEAMTAGARAFGHLLPLTWYLEAQSQAWILDAPINAIVRTQLTMLAFPVVFFAIALPLFAWRLPRWAKAEAKAAALTRAEEEVAFGTPTRSLPTVGFWRTFALALERTFLSRDTAIIAGGAVAFYLILYGWPYGTQQIEHVPVGVVDLDHSSVSRRLIAQLDASPTTALQFVVHDEAEGLDALKRRVTDVLVTIPSGYAEKLARGENSTLHVLGNGAFPVKARAVQGAVGGIVGDSLARVDEASILTPGISPATLGAATLARPSIHTTYRFNEIGGYGNYTVPLVGPVIIQAVMLMCIGMSLGGWLARRPREAFMQSALAHPFSGGMAILFAYFTIAFGWSLYMQGFAFWFGEFGSMSNPLAVVLASALYAAAVASFGSAVTALAGSNAWIAPLTVILSAPSLFASGAVWPVEKMHPFVTGVAQLMPTTPYIPTSAAAAQDGATLAAILPGCLHLALLALLYTTATLAILKRRNDQEALHPEASPRALAVNDIE